MPRKEGVSTIIHTISLIDEWLDRVFHEQLKHVGDGNITPKYAVALHVLRSAGGELPITELAQQLCRSKPYVTHMVNELQSTGCFTRGKNHSDHRINSVIITPKGLAYAEEIDELVLKTVTEELDFLPPEELDILAILLRKVAAPFRPNMAERMRGLSESEILQERLSDTTTGALA